MVRGASFPPAGVVVVRRDFLETELLVVIGSDPFGGIDRALLERRIDVAAGNLLGHYAELLQGRAGPAADAHLETLEVLDGFDLLAEPAAHLRAGIPAYERVDVRLLRKVVHQLHAVAVVEPGILLAGVEAERDRAEQRPGRVLADEIVGRGVAHLDRAVLRRIEHLQAGHDLAGRERLNLKLVVGRFRYVFGYGLAGAVKGIERLWPACRQSPLELRHRLRHRGRGNRRCGRADPGNLEKFATLHRDVPLLVNGANTAIGRRVARYCGSRIGRGGARNLGARLSSRRPPGKGKKAATFSSFGVRRRFKDALWHAALGCNTIDPSLPGRRHVDVKLHLGMDAAEHQEAAGRREAHLDRLARLLRAGIEIERRIKHPHIVRAGIVVDDPQAITDPQRDVAGKEGLVVLRHGRDLLGGRARARLDGHDGARRHRLAFAGQRAEKGDEIGTFAFREIEALRQVLGERRPLDHAALVVAKHGVEGCE